MGFLKDIFDIGDRIVQLADDTYDPNEYRFQRYQESLHKERQLHRYAQKLVDEAHEAEKQYRSMQSRLYSDDVYTAEYNRDQAVRRAEKAVEEYKRQRRKTDRLREELRQSDPCVPNYGYDPDYEPGPSIAAVAKWLGKQVDRYRDDMRNPWVNRWD